MEVEDVSGLRHYIISVRKRKNCIPKCSVDRLNMGKKLDQWWYKYHICFKMDFMTKCALTYLKMYLPLTLKLLKCINGALIT